MPKLDQKGAAHLLVPILLLIGLIATLYIVTQGSPLKLFSKATLEDKIEFKSLQKDANGNYAELEKNSAGQPKVQIAETTGDIVPFVWVEVTSKNPPAPQTPNNIGVGDSVLGVNSQTVVTIRAWGDKRRGIVPSIILADGSKKLFTYSVTAPSKQNAQTFTYTFPGSQTFINKPMIQFTNDKTAGDGSSDKEDRNAYIDYITINGVKYETEDAKTYSSGSWSQANGCEPGYKQQESLNCNGFFRYDGFTLVAPTPKPTVKPTTTPTPKPTVTPVPTSNPTPSSQPTAAPTVAPTPISTSTPTQVYTTHFQYAENLVDLDNAPLIPYTPATKAFGYTFKDKTHGVKSLLVQFIDSDGTKHQVDTKYSQIEIVYPPVPTSTPSPTSTPTPTLSATPAPSPTPQASLEARVFVTSTTYNGKIGGVAGANAKCQQRADAANLGGIWGAWLSVGDVAPSWNFNHAGTNSIAYKLINGTIVAKSWTDLKNSDRIGLVNPINVTEYGEIITSPTTQLDVWTNTTAYGGYDSANNDQSCYGYTSSSSDYYGHGGSVQKTNYQWSSNNFRKCNEMARLYCFEQIKSEPIPLPTSAPIINTPTPITSKRVFVTSNIWLGAGLNAASPDYQCSYAANQANLGGTWVSSMNFEPSYYGSYKMLNGNSVGTTLNIDENGSTVASYERVWVKDPGNTNNCSGPTGRGTVRQISNISFTVTNSCASGFGHLFCFEK